MHGPPAIRVRGEGWLRRVDVAGAAHLELVSGVIRLRPEDAMGEAMLRGWWAQQMARGLREETIAERERLVRHFMAFTNEYPWRWTPAHVDDWSMSLTGERHLAPATIRAYQRTLRIFNEFLCDGRYGWAVACEQEFGPDHGPDQAAGRAGHHLVLQPDLPAGHGAARAVEPEDPDGAAGHPRLLDGRAHRAGRGRLHGHGLQPRQGRNTALFMLAAEVPAAILATMLGIHIKAAIQWQHLSNGDWTSYAAGVSERSSSSANPATSNNRTPQ